MKQIVGLTSDDQTVRTQITLTKKLKELIEQEIKPDNISLSEYIRQASIIKLYLDRQKRQDLSDLADRVVGSVELSKHPEWETMEKTIAWQRKIRKEWKR